MAKAVRQLKGVGIKAKPAPKVAATVEDVKAPVVVAAPKASRPAPRPRVDNTSKHDVESLYVAGPSKGFNERKSVTALPLDQFNTAPDYVLTLRTENIGETLKRKYGGNPFPLANADRGALKFLIRKGHVRVVSGDGRSPATQLQFTQAGMAARYAAA